MGSMGLDLPQVGITPGTTWASMLNDALVPLVEEHDHSAGKGIFVKTSGLVGINVNGDLNFQDIDPISPTFGDYNRSVNLRSIRLNQLTTPGSPAGFDPDTLTLMTDLTDLWFRDGSGTLIQLTSGGFPFGGRRYGVQGDYDSLTPNDGWASYHGGALDQYTFGPSDPLIGLDNTSILNCQGLIKQSLVTNEFAGTEVVPIGTEFLGIGGGVRIGYSGALAAPDPTLYTYPDLWAVEVAPDTAVSPSPGSVQNGFRVQGTLISGTGDPSLGPQHLDLTATALNPPLGS